MEKTKILFLIGIIVVIVIIPVTIFASKIIKNKVDDLREINTVIMGTDSVEVFKEKSREEQTKEKIEKSKQYQNNETANSSEINNINENNSDMENAKSEKVLAMEKDLGKIANKYNKQEEFENITAIIEKQEIKGNFTEEHKKLCEMFLNIYEKESLTEEEKSVMKEFFEIIKLNNIDLQLEGRINNIIK